MFDCLAYISKNKIELLNLTTNETVYGTADFTSNRLLLGDINIAGELIKHLMKKINSQFFSFVRPRIIIQPLEMVEGGLCQIEEVTLTELGEVAGARKTIIHIEDKMIAREKALTLFKNK